MGTKYQGTEEQKRALNLYIKLTRAVNTIESRLERRASKKGLTISQFGVLEALLHIGPMSQREISEKLLKSGGNITLVIDNLEKQALVQRVRCPQDRRQITVSLTAKGDELIRDIFPGHVDAIVDEMSVLSPEEQETLQVLLRRLGRKMTETVRE